MLVSNDIRSNDILGQSRPGAGRSRESTKSQETGGVRVIGLRHTIHRQIHPTATNKGGRSLFPFPKGMEHSLCVTEQNQALPMASFPVGLI